MSPARTSILTRAIFQIHLWSGLALGIYAVLIGVTGSVLVFHEEIVQRISPEPRVAAAEAPARLDDIRDGIQAHYPDLHPWSVEAPWDAGDPWASYLLGSGGGKMVYADATGLVVGENATEGTWLQYIAQFHSYLLLPRGRLLNGIAGLALVGLAVTGLILWWPERGEWSSAFQIVRRSNWKGLVFDLHRVGGVLSLGFTVLFAVTGAYYTWPAAYRDVAAAVLSTQDRPSAIAVETDGPRLPIDDLVASATRAVPGARLVRVLVPRGDKQPVTVVLSHGDTSLSRRMRTSQVVVHPKTGEVLSLDDFRERRAGDHLVGWLGPLHAGNFGGTAVKVIWAAAGLALPALSITGFLMWKNRVLTPRLARRRTRTSG